MRAYYLGMTALASARVTSAASPQAFFDRWADMATWPEWNLDTDWVRLDGPFTEGATGTLKPKGGFAVRFAVERLVPGEIFLDVSYLPGARLVFDHGVRLLEDGRTEVSVQVRLSGPLAPLWRLILGSGVASSVQPDLERLAAVAEAAENAKDQS